MITQRCYRISKLRAVGRDTAAAKNRPEVQGKARFDSWPLHYCKAGEREMNKYVCRHCGKVVSRDSKKAWVKSYCTKTDRTVHLVKVKK